MDWAVLIAIVLVIMGVSLLAKVFKAIDGKGRVILKFRGELIGATLVEETDTAVCVRFEVPEHLAKDDDECEFLQTIWYEKNSPEVIEIVRKVKEEQAG